MLISEPAAESKFLAIMQRKLFRFWLNYRCPGKRSNTSVGPMLMACGGAGAPSWVSEGLGDKPRGLEAQRCIGWEGWDPLLAQRVIVSSEEERKHLTLKETLPSRPRRSGQLLTHLISSPSWPRKLGRARSGNAVAQLPSFLAARRGAGAVRAAPGLGEDGALLNLVSAAQPVPRERCPPERSRQRQRRG